MNSYDNKFTENNFAFANNNADSENISITNNMDAQLAEALSMGPGGPEPKKKKTIAKILIISGTVKKGDNKKAWPGTTLTEDDTIVVSARSYVGVVAVSSGKTIEIKQAGTYKVKDLVDLANNNNPTLIEKYFDYIGKEVMKGKKEDINKNHTKNSAISAPDRDN
jgi:hypothetical protein